MMYIDLKYKTNRKMPVACDFVAGMVCDVGPSLLAWNRATSLFIGIRSYGETFALDQQEVAEALQAAHESAVASAPQQEVAEAHTGPMKLRSVSLDEETVRALRDYGNGNLSAGIRAAAKVVTGT